MSEALQRPIFYYNLQESQLLTGSDTYAQAIDSGSHPADIIPLRELVMNAAQYGSLIPRGAEIKPTNLDVWDEDTLVSLTQWLGREVLGEESNLISDYLAVLNRLGLAPSEKAVATIMGGYSALYEAADLPNARRRGRYDMWDVERFTRYVCQIVRRLPKTESYIKALNAKAKNGEGPSYRIVKRRIPGGVPRLLARDGLYDFQEVDDEYFLDWGVDFMVANNGRLVDSDALDLLSPKRMSPSRTTVSRRFTSIEKFNEQASERYFDVVEKTKQQNGDRFEKIMQEIHDGALPTSILAGCRSEADMRHVVGKYRLLQSYCPTLDQKKLEDAARLSRDQVMRVIRQHHRNLPSVEIEFKAEALGVFEDVWPTLLKYNRLKVA